MRYTIKIFFLTAFTFLCAFSSSARFRGSEGGNVSKTFTVNKGGSLDVSVNCGDILITTWDKSEVHVEATSEDEEEPGGIQIYQKDKTIYVEYEPKWGSSDGMQFRISIP